MSVLGVVPSWHLLPLSPAVKPCGGTVFGKGAPFDWYEEKPPAECAWAIRHHGDRVESHPGSGSGRGGGGPAGALVRVGLELALAYASRCVCSCVCVWGWGGTCATELWS